jgi:hypothetical protein
LTTIELICVQPNVANVAPYFRIWPDELSRNLFKFCSFSVLPFDYYSG